MKRIISTVCMGLVILLFAARAPAQEILPNLFGVWSAEGSVLVQDKSGNEPASRPSRQIDIHGVLTINQQEGARFTGKKVLEGDFEEVFGFIRFDNLSAMVINEQGFETWTFPTPDRIEGFSMVEFPDRIQASTILYVRIPPRTR
ncbi:MAG: hypothetical protein ACLFTB_00990 [Desulfovibrionales bacterium]